jgi:hypothetical protein
MECFNTDNTQVQLTMVIKLQQLQRTALPSLVYCNLEDYLARELWKKHLPDTLHEAVNDVMNVTADDLVRFLSAKAIQDGKSQHLDDFTDLIGGNRNE